MRLLVDECCDPRLVAALREAGHDVRYVLETDPGSDDDTVVALSIAEDRILITEDKDFGELAVRRRAPLPGLVLLRFAPENRHRKPEQVVALLARHGDGLRGRYAVVDERSVRSARHRPLPRAR